MCSLIQVGLDTLPLPLPLLPRPPPPRIRTQSFRCSQTLLAVQLTLAPMLLMVLLVVLLPVVMTVLPTAVLPAKTAVTAPVPGQMNHVTINVRSNAPSASGHHSFGELQENVFGIEG